MNIKLAPKFEISFDVNDEAKLYTFANPYSYYLLLDTFGNELNKFNSIYADGIFLVKLYNLFNECGIQRFSFDYTSVAPMVFNFVEENKLNLAIIGGSNKEIELAIERIKLRFPSLNLVYYRDGFFEDLDDVLFTLKNKSVEVLICGMGTPLQERVLLSAKDKVPSLKIGYTCGGFLSQISANENYFNPILNRLHLRWLQRFFRHSYVRKRILVDYPRFLIRFLRNNFS